MTQKLKEYYEQLNINKSKLLVIVCLAVALVFVSFFTPIYDIKEIIVAGNSKIGEDVLIRASGIDVGENIFKADIADRVRTCIALYGLTQADFNSYSIPLGITIH